ncbi:MAG: M23 family metallopeptidase [Hyphomicrobiales bacterium]|nr:MAG: M23 family metallopeptidase [Hyphomicrobiales bacterium]
MRNRVTNKALKVAAIVGLFAGAAALSGCTALGSRAFGDRTVTGSVGQSSSGNLSQPMPMALAPSSTRVASGPFIPPSDIGGGGGGGTFVSSALPNSGSGPMGSVSTEDLPVLASSNSGNAQMSAQPQLAPVAPAPQTVLASVPAASSGPALVSVPGDAYVHVIASGESLYTIARLYNVTAQGLVSANGLSSPDKIYVGQKIIVPGMKGSGAPKGSIAPVPASKPSGGTQAPTVVAEVTPNDSTPIASPQLLESNTPVNKPLVQPKAEPKLSGADKFRWPVSGRVITDFGNSKGTGINIEAPEGAAIRAAENGQVIYVGSGVEGYGNLILIRHPNGYVSAYAHLKEMSVTKGDVVNRGDNIGAAGMTGGVSRPQLHFELRKGATPVDPVPLLAS